MKQTKFRKSDEFDRLSTGLKSDTLGQGERLTCFCRRCAEAIRITAPGLSLCWCGATGVEIVRSGSIVARRAHGDFAYRVESTMQEEREAA